MPRATFAASVIRLAVQLAILFCAAGSLPFAANAAEFVIHISVDGLNPHWLEQVIDAGEAPTFKRLQDEGAWTDNARTDYTYTVTLPNHTSMLTGRPVSQPEGMSETVNHGFVLNDTMPRGATLHNSGNPNVRYVASTFDVAHDAGLATALVVSKDKFAIYDESYNEKHGAPGPHGRDKIDYFFFQDDGPPTYSAEMNRRFLEELARRHFNYSFVHYRDLDSAGHAFGWGSPTYLQAIAAIDGYLADVLRLVESDPVLAGKTAIIITADHGGIESNHFECERCENFTIPVIAWGAGVDRGDLYAINAETRADPVDSRPDYNAPSQPIRNGDTGNLALQLLGLGPIPGSMINAKQDLHVHRELVGDYNGDGAVDTADYSVWRNTLNSTSDLRADGNADGVVDDADYELWKVSSGQAAKREP